MKMHFVSYEQISDDDYNLIATLLEHSTSQFKVEFFLTFQLIDIV